VRDYTIKTLDRDSLLDMTKVMRLHQGPVALPDDFLGLARVAKKLNLPFVAGGTIPNSDTSLESFEATVIRSDPKALIISGSLKLTDSQARVCAGREVIHYSIDGYSRNHYYEVPLAVYAPYNDKIKNAFCILQHARPVVYKRPYYDLHHLDEATTEVVLDHLKHVGFGGSRVNTSFDHLITRFGFVKTDETGNVVNEISQDLLSGFNPFTGINLEDRILLSGIPERCILNHVLVLSSCHVNCVSGPARPNIAIAKSSVAITFQACGKYGFNVDGVLVFTSVDPALIVKNKSNLLTFSVRYGSGRQKMAIDSDRIGLHPEQKRANDLMSQVSYWQDPPDFIWGIPVRVPEEMSIGT